MDIDFYTFASRNPYGFQPTPEYCTRLVDNANVHKRCPQHPDSYRLLVDSGLYENYKV